MALELTWWGCAAVELRDGDAGLLIDPYLHVPDGPVQGACITHADYDHCHEPTLRRLVGRPEFERLLAPPSCTRMSVLDVPCGDEPEDLAFVPDERLLLVAPRIGRNPAAEPDGPDTAEVAGFAIETIESGEHPQRY